MTDMIELLEEYEAWKRRLHHPDNSLAAFKDYYFTQQVLVGALEIWGDQGKSMFDSTVLRDVLSEDTLEWLNTQHVEKEFALE